MKGKIPLKMTIFDLQGGRGGEVYCNVYNFNSSGRGGDGG